MVALQIRDVRDALAEQARSRGQSLQSYLLDLVETEARRAHNASVLDRFTERTDGSRSTPDDTVAELGAAETSGCAFLTADARLAGAVGIRCPIRLIAETPLP